MKENPMKELFEKLIILIIFVMSLVNLFFSIHNFYSIRQFDKSTYKDIIEKIDTINIQLDALKANKIQNLIEQIDFIGVDNVVELKQKIIDLEENNISEINTRIKNLENINITEIGDKINELENINITEIGDKINELVNENITEINSRINNLEVSVKNIKNELQIYSSKIWKLYSGTFEFYWSKSPNYELHKGYFEYRFYTYTIYFPERYSNIPKVFVTLIRFDFSNSGNTRVGMNVKYINEIGFHVEIYTWEKCRLYGGIISWFSYGY